MALAWSLPKNDWAGSDVPGTTDFDRIENNIWSREYTYSGNYSGSALSSISTGLSYDMGNIGFVAPDGYSVYLHSASWVLTNVNPSWKLDVGVVEPTGWWPTIGYLSSFAYGSDSPDYELYRNTSGSSATGYITVRALNVASTGQALTYYHGFSISYSIRPTP